MGLTGRWTIERSLLDRSLDAHGTFTGVLEVTPDELGFRWHEAGTLRWDGRELPAHRTLALRRIDGSWWMTFADGSRFHPWVIGEPVIHPCAADTYRGLIERTGPSTMTIVWDVTGPTKNQLIVSRLERSADDLVEG